MSFCGSGAPMILWSTIWRKRNENSPHIGLRPLAAGVHVAGTILRRTVASQRGPRARPQHRIWAFCTRRSDSEDRDQRGTVSTHPASCQDALRWLRRRGWSLGPLTDQDYAVLTAVAHCWRLWVAGDAAAQLAALDAATALLDGCQEVCWPMARELIAHAGDWSHRDLVWPKVVERFRARHARQFGTGADWSRADRLMTCHIGLKLVEPRSA